MSSSNQYSAPIGRSEERRSSLAALASTSGLIKGDTNHNVINFKGHQAKRPLASVMSEDHSATQHTQPPPNTQKQSFLSKFARSEIKSSKSIDKSTQLNKTNDIHGSNKAISVEPDGSNHKPRLTILDNKSSLDLESDKGACSRPPKSKSGLGSNLLPTRVSKSFCESSTSEHTSKMKDIASVRRRALLQSDRDTDINNNTAKDNNDPDEDEDNQVIPTWPSRIDAAALEPSMVQVYSLKDYSQVTGPTENVVSFTTSGRLMKSMSQDRRVDSRKKRMSECILSSMAHGGPFYSDSKSTNEARQHRLPSIMGKIATTNLSSMGPATSVNSLLPQSKNSPLISESRIDRMRKLFVSPLSLRGSTGSKSSSQSSHKVSNHSRLSLQSGASMLNKPHHLMHVMYRKRVGTHHSRRSPMRQKSGAIKGFRVYGCPLNMANTIYPITCFGRPDIYKRQSVPYILARLCNYIEEHSSQLTHEGIFRVSGNARLMEKLKTLFDHLGDAPLESECVDVATSASMLKMYLRELPDPVIPTRMNYYFFTLAKKYSSLMVKSSFNGFIASDNVTTTSTPLNGASSVSDDQSTLDRQKSALMRDLTKLIRKLPIDNYNLLKYLACFLHRISLKQQSNKMSAEALGIVFGPNVFRIRSESYKGLKEQELSNQIMACIISNYKQIFDCELTDPLGNLIRSQDSIYLDREKKAIKENTHQTNDLDIAEPGEPTTSLCRKDGSKSSPPTPSTSSTAYGLNSHRQLQYYPILCPKHGSRINYLYSEDVNEDRNHSVEEDDVDNLERDEEDCEGDGSYTRSSGSGSYCSSLASETDGSIYEGDVEGGQYDDEEDDEFEELGSGSSSGCVSETSYTPSSSHSGSETDDAELSSSTFGSVKSLNGPNGTDDNDANSGEPRKPCLVCKRRESQQIEVNKMCEQLRISPADELSSNDSKEANKDRHESDDRDAAMGPHSSGYHQSVQVKNHHRTSSRRKRSGNEANRTSSMIKAVEVSANTTAITKSDMEIGVTNLLKQATSIANNEDRSSRHTRRNHPEQTSSHGLLRRRSSSASSLFRMSTRRDQGSRYRSAGKGDQNYHGHRVRMHSDRRRYNNHDPRSYNRKSKNKSGLSGRKHAHDQFKPDKQSGSSNKNNSGSTRTFPPWKPGDYYIPEFSGLNLSAETGDELVWSYISSSFLDVPEFDRLGTLRSYNSDETLLRTQECSTTNSDEISSRARRRFSGQDYLNANQQDLLASACSQFNQIFETYEDDNLSAVDSGTRDNKKKRAQTPQKPCETLLSTTSKVAKSSVISLLDDQMVSFKHSSLSLSDDTFDPIVDQLKVIKDLVRALERILKHGTTHGIEQNVSDLTFQLIDDESPGGRLHNIASCGVDYLTGLSITVALENIKREFSLDQPKINPKTQRRLCELVSVKIADLKKRYNNLKYIREHYHKHHAKHQAKRHSEEQHSVDKISRAAKKEFKNSDQSISQIHERNSMCSDVSSLGSTATTIVSYCHNQPAIPLSPQNQADISSPSEAMALVLNSCKFGALCPVEFVFNIEKHLLSRRLSGSRFVRIGEMTTAQLQGEKLELQKNLLRYEHWFGRPTTRSEINLVGHLYDRYHTVKIIKQRKQSSE